MLGVCWWYVHLGVGPGIERGVVLTVNHTPSVTLCKKITPTCVLSILEQEGTS